MMLLQTLSEAVGVSGNEAKVRAELLTAVREHADELRVDTIGNILALKRGTGQQALRVMVAAHMDEVGLMVVGHDGDGFLKVRAVGGVDPRLLPGRVLQVGDGAIPGVIGVKPIHLLEQGEGEKAPPLENLVVDIGASSKDEAERLAPLGTTIAFTTPFRELGPTVTGKAFDDRAGCTVLAELLRGERFPFDLHAVFTVQEEVGLRGARVAAYAIEPDCGFALEATVADDLPKDKDVSPTTVLGQGPAITVMDRSFIADRRLVTLLTSAAEANGIPYQIKQPGVGGTDSGAIHAVHAGVPSVTVAVPCRYIHSPVSLLSLEDLGHTVHLMREALSRLTGQMLRRD
ncbi:MAG: M42 family metallopeptidase [Anaerolineales bacterium]|nr:M42 family metallopeptidase [Anaerolineales bacterium]